MKLKQLEGLLGSLQQFENPKIELEQYPTGPHIASRLLYTAENSFGDVSDKVVADFGCGCGTLGLAAGLLGAEHVIGFDIDAESIEIASSNADELELDMDFIQCDIRNLRLSDQAIDTVVMNPPFGTRKKGADMDFLSMALKVASGAVYSLHKTTTRDVSLLFFGTLDYFIVSPLDVFPKKFTGIMWRVGRKNSHCSLCMD
ncbi:UNVERIFIED_CONTAM: rRNA N6-adenosine-methyltransferase METTL5 [Sesamum calycinum]|uniref:Methyltransferase-like protein 5 n=1 Tax=Sesamum calycinum TaxID=2727403 RepID=A0AAW2N3M5_9LAMI